MKNIRSFNRKENEMRPVEIKINANKYADGSCLIRFGDTTVMCTASIEEKVPTWMKGTHQGWITAEYGMLPRSTETRMEREAKKGQNGRTHEIQRLIGRALRGCVDLSLLNNITIKLDCDVIQADGGTRTASITGAFVALYLACQKLVRDKKIETFPITHFVAAISCGICEDTPLLDLDYIEDSNAQTDANFVANELGQLIEIQATAERKNFLPEQFTKLLELGIAGTQQLIKKQKEVLIDLESLLK